jgi:hypothetical protein
MIDNRKATQHRPTPRMYSVTVLRTGAGWIGLAPVQVGSISAFNDKTAQATAKTIYGPTAVATLNR